MTPIPSILSLLDIRDPVTSSDLGSVGGVTDRYELGSNARAPADVAGATAALTWQTVAAGDDQMSRRGRALAGLLTWRAAGTRVPRRGECMRH